MKDIIKDNFKESKQEYREFIKVNKRCPTEKEWNEIAKKKKLLSSLSMRYMGNIKFKKEIF